MNISRNQGIPALLLLMLVISSCSPLFYSTVGQNVPLFSSKGEFFLSGGTTAVSNRSEADTPSADASGYAIQGAASLSNRVALISNFYSLRNIGSDNLSGKGTYFELGAGLYHKYPSNIVYEFFVGNGFGHIENKVSDGHADAAFIKPFIQPSIGYSTRIVEIAATGRMGVVNYSSQTNTVSDQQTHAMIHDFYSSTKSKFVFEPGLTIRAGWQNYKLQFQLNYSTFRYKNHDFDPVASSYSSFGITCMIGRKWEGKHIKSRSTD